MAQGFMVRRRKKGVTYEQVVNYTMLYDQGNECEDVTGGWVEHLRFFETQPDGFAVKQTGYLEFGDENTGDITQNSKYGNGGFYAANAIDLSAYKMYCADVEMVMCTQYNKNYPAVVIAVTSSLPPYLWSHNQDHINDIADAWPIEPTREFDLTDTDKGIRTVGVMPIDINKSAYLSVCQQSFAYPGVAGISRCHAAWLVKPDNIKGLCELAGVEAESAAELVAYASSILNSEKAVEYMICRCTGDFMMTAIKDSGFKSELEKSAYREKIYANEHWGKFLDMVNKERS